MTTLQIASSLHNISLPIGAVGQSFSEHLQDTAFNGIARDLADAGLIAVYQFSDQLLACRGAINCLIEARNNRAKIAITATTAYFVRATRPGRILKKRADLATVLGERGIEGYRGFVLFCADAISVFDLNYDGRRYCQGVVLDHAALRAQGARA